ncbi:MAG: hypothetical protein IKV35_07210 [Clostridia bacterium]|nr:hypothetical protein [Clostridia bacterium]
MDKKPEYSVDDILLEYELRKRGTSDAKNATDEATNAPVRRPRSAAETFAPSARQEEVVRKPVEIHPVREDEEEETVKTDLPHAAPTIKSLPKKEADTRPLGPVNPPKAKEKNVPISTRTRVLTVAETTEKYQTAEIPSSSQLEGQLVMENFADDPVDEEKLEEELRERRRQKIEGFRIIEGGKSPLKLTGDEEETSEDEEIIEPLDEEEDEDEIEDFNDYAEAEAIRSELRYRQRTGALTLLATLGLEAFLIPTALMYEYGWLEALAPVVIVAFSLIVLLGIAALNYRIIGHGFRVLFKGRADADTPAAVCGVIGILYTLVQFAMLDRIGDGDGVMLAAAAGLALTAGRFGRQMQIMRVRRNFAVVGNEKLKKQVACVVEDEKTLRELGKAMTTDGIPSVVYYRRAAFLDGFLQQSYAADPADRVMRWFVPIVLGVAALCAGGYAVLNPSDAWNAVTLFAATVLAAMPIWAMFSSQRALSRSCKKLLSKGAVAVGWNAVETFGKPVKAVVVDAGELFENDQVKLHGIKTFSGTRIDEAITDAAAVVIEAGGPLSPIFHRLIENRTEILREVDSLAYEQDMGLSGWVGGRRVLIGNRRLLANHGVEVPSEEYEERYTKDGRSTVYLSTAGELSAMFVVSYLANPAVKSQMKALARERVMMMVRTCDPNITDSLLCDVMELPMRSVEVMTAGEGRAHETLVETKDDAPASALVASVGRGVSRLMPVVQCRRLHRGVWAALVAQLAVSAAALLFGIFVSAVTGSVLSESALLAAAIVSGALGYLIPRMMRT